MNARLFSKKSGELPPTRRGLLCKNHESCHYDTEDTNEMLKKRAKILLLLGMGLSALNLGAQENRKAISSPTPIYPETARRFRLSGVVKVQVTIAPDGQVKDIKVIGGHPLLVSAVQDTLKNWKYATASSETTALLEFSFHP